MTPSRKVLIVGAGPGGLAVAAALGSEGVPATIVERATSVGSSWRGHYDRLHLHTARFLSGLPGMPIPRQAGSWVSRDDFVAYLEAYTVRHALDVQTGTEARRLDRMDGGWRVATSAGEVDATHVVVATGYNRVPLLPEWPGREAFAGTLLHSSRYRSGTAYRGKDVLVVGAGNSGAEIAVDLVEKGAARVRLSIRRPANVVLRTVAGFVPSQLVSILLSKLPLPFADAVARATARLTIGDLRKLGLPAPDRGIYTEMIRDRQIPIIDVGLVSALRAGRVEVVPAVEGFDGPSVRLVGGESNPPGRGGRGHGLPSVARATGRSPGRARRSRAAPRARRGPGSRGARAPFPRLLQPSHGKSPRDVHRRPTHRPAGGEELEG